MEDKDFLSGPASINIEEVMQEIRARLANSEISTKVSEINSFEAVHRLSDPVERLNEMAMHNNQNWDIDIDFPITSHRKFLGPVISLAKRIVRKLLRWYISRPWEQQIAFNASVMETIQGIAEEAKQGLNDAEKNKSKMMDELKHYIDQNVKDMSDKLGAISERTRRTERSLKDQVINIPGKDCPTSTATATPSGENLIEFDYFMFEQRFRGSCEEIKDRQRVYLDYFKDKHDVLDLGCGRGEFLELMRESGISAIGLDSNQDMVSYVRDLGLDVKQVDVRTYLKDMITGVDGIFAAQLIEHLTPADMVSLIRICHDKLDHGGILALETVNPTCLSVFAESFYMDLSHIRPVHPATLAFVLEQEGFTNVQTLYLSPFPDAEKIPNLPIEGADEFNAGIQRLNSRMYSYRDYAVVGEKI